MLDENHVRTTLPCYLFSFCEALLKTRILFEPLLLGFKYLKIASTMESMDGNIFFRVILRTECLRKHFDDYCEPTECLA